MSRRKEIMKDAGIYTLSSYAAQFLDIASGILIRRVLGPTNMGIWAFLQVIQNYAKHAGLGITTATARDVPYLLGKGEKTKAEEVANLVASFTFVTAAITSAGVIIYALINRGKLTPGIFYGLFAISALILLQRFYNYFVTILRSYKQFTFAGILNFISSALNLVLTVGLAWRFGLYGFFGGVILNYILLNFWLFSRTPVKMKLNFNFRDLRPLLGLGLAMLLSDILRTVITNIDRIMTAKFLGFEELGYYSIALMAGNYLYSLPNMISIIFFPHLQETFARRDSHQDLEPFLREPVLCTAYLFPFLIAFVWAASAWIVPVILPQYGPGIPSMKIYILGSFFMALTHPFSSFLITVKKHWHLVPLQTGCAVLGFLTTYLFIRQGYGIQGIAIGSAITAALQFFILSFTSYREMGSLSGALRIYGKVLMVFVWFLAALAISEALFASWPESFAKFSAQLLIICLVLSPLLFLAEKEARVFSTLLTFFKSAGDHVKGTVKSGDAL